MARKKSDDVAALRASVGEQVAACRSLANAMRADADSRSVLDRGNRKLVRRWADQIDEIAGALEEAMLEGSRAGIFSLSKLARCLATPVLAVSSGLAGGAAQGFGAEAYGYLFGDSQEMKQPAAVVVEQADRVEDLVTRPSVGAALDPLTQPLEFAPIATGRPTSFARTIFRIRSTLGLTQQQVADLLGMSQPAVSNWELGYTRPSRPRHVWNTLAPLLEEHRGLRRRLAETLGVNGHLRIPRV